LRDYKDFEIHVEQVNRGLRLQLVNAPGIAFVNGRIIEGIREQLSSVIRDLIYHDTIMRKRPAGQAPTSAGITNTVFEMLRNARALIPQVDPDLVVCWGGHSISQEEYEYTKDCGYQMGLRDINIITGCGPGAMKGPMKGAAIGHAKQRVARKRYIGISEPGIIAAESPNPIVTELVIMPDIEKRLEAFVRLGHGIVVFPGGVGTTEEILYLLGILLHPDNRDLPFPMVLSGPVSAAGYFEQVDRFIRLTLGDAAAARYEVVIDDPEKVAQLMQRGLTEVRKFRITRNDAFYFNWLLHIDMDFQMPFEPTHENMGNQSIRRELPTHELAANLRRVFSGLVAGNVKPEGLKAVREHGKFEISGDNDIMVALDELLQAFVRDGRMKLPGGTAYEPCFRVLG